MDRKLEQAKTALAARRNARRLEIVMIDASLQRMAGSSPKAFYPTVDDAMAAVAREEAKS
jgi:hypothetical protein